MPEKNIKKIYLEKIASYNLKRKKISSNEIFFYGKLLQ